MIRIEHVRWPAVAVNTFNWFFYNLENHVLRQQVERVLLHYTTE
ncbi:hypothetical protein ID866_9288 [Astraeus odoratus]|nr:hypothetical protein ID866_9288 [Astraeus odoratus]